MLLIDYILSTTMLIDLPLAIGTSPTSKESHSSRQAMLIPYAVGTLLFRAPTNVSHW